MYAQDARIAQEAALERYIEDLLAQQAEMLTRRIDELTGQLGEADEEREGLLAQIATLQARIAELEAGAPEPEPEDDESVRGPIKSFPATDQGIADARAYYRVPAGANAVLIRATDTRSVEQIHASGSANDVFFFEGRAEPYWYDVAQGPMAPGAVSYDGIDANGKIDRVNRVQITNPGTRAWFSFTRTRRGIIGLDPRVVFAPRGTLSRPAFAVLEDQTQLPAAERIQYWYKANGSVGGTILGCPIKLFECETNDAIFAGFTLRGPESFGGMQFGGLSIKGDGRVVRVRFEGCWRSGASVPNTETGALGLHNSTYHVELCQFAPVGPTTSAIMTNNSRGGYLGNCEIPKVTNGLMTHWRPTGVHVMEDIDFDGGQKGFNLEELRPGFELRWTGGSFRVDRGRHHFGINPVAADNKAPAPPKITLTDVDVSQDAWAFVNGGLPGLDLNVYQGSPSDPVCAKKSWISHTNDGEAQPVQCVPGSRWVA